LLLVQSREGIVPGTGPIVAALPAVSTVDLDGLSAPAACGPRKLTMEFANPKAQAKRTVNLIM